MSERVLNVYYLPQQVAQHELAGSAVVVIDVLRATSTICQALASGASEVVPFLEAEAAPAAARDAPGEVVLGGERKGLRIEGFDLGNSPREYTTQAVGGRRVFITTTNGTRAMHHARQAARIVLGSLLNLSAAVASVENEQRVNILCAGTDGHETDEDILTAGGMVHRLCQLPTANWRLNDAAAMAGANWSQLTGAAQVGQRTIIVELARRLGDSPGGRNLMDIGLEQDVVDCAQLDRLDVVPELDVRTWRITASQRGKV